MLFCSSCSTNQQSLHKKLSRHDNKHSKYEGHYKIGKPYKINSVRYEPYLEVKKNHTEKGKASWYGRGDHNKKTANGDTFNKYMLTAAHRQLPMPCIAKVTNLTNQKQIIVMVNDRGPYRGNRIVDLSEAAAERLGFKGQGVTDVKLEYMHEETTRLLSKLGLQRKHGSRAKTKHNFAKGCSANCYLELLNAKHNLIELSANQKKLYEKSIKINDV